ncbi:MAG TPA: anhydro-N-acetylmuramic acid kinase [Micropepsaceae bacterium]|nr:anhydro-N-acetylmuramic acid kinase [Micropepsaceae bacterium]
MADVLKVIGLMSGTSLDGIDAAILDTDGEAGAVPGPALTRPYDSGTRTLLRAALEAASHTPPEGPVPPEIAKAERLLTDAHIAAVLALLEKAARKPGDIALLGFHGQTVLHRPSDRRTWQIGDGEALARATGIAVVNEFRKADVAAGGQGAPFVPLYHQVLARNLERPVAVVNIGGVANLTYVGAKGELMAFDTGPGNAALDDWALAHTGKPVDSDGKLAARGRVNETVLASMLRHPMFLQPPPKSLDRFDFPMAAVEGLSGPDGAATLTAFTAAAIARANEQLPRPPRRWMICGGGRHNPTLMRELRARLTGEVTSAEDAGWRGDFLEAEAFGYLAVRSVRGLPLSLPSTTGVPYPMPGGRLHSPHTPSSVRA